MVRKDDMGYVAQMQEQKSARWYYDISFVAHSHKWFSTASPWFDIIIFFY